METRLQIVLCILIRGVSMMLSLSLLLLRFQVAKCMQWVSFGSITDLVSFAAAQTAVTQCSPPTPRPHRDYHRCPKLTLKVWNVNLLSPGADYSAPAFSQQSRGPLESKISCISEHSSCSVLCADLQAVPLNDPKRFCGRISNPVFYSSRACRLKSVNLK